MKKKVIIIIIAVLLILTLLVGLIIIIKGRNSFNDSKKIMGLGDVAETDVSRLTLVHSQLCIALNNATSETEMFKPKEYDSTKDLQNPYVASKGHTLVSFTIKIENLDRGSLNLAGNFNPDFTQVKYNEKKYNSKAIIKAKSKDNITWEKYNSDNILLLAGETYYYRGYIDIETDANLEDVFEISFYLPNSKGKTEKFDFNITKNDLDNFVEPEISLHDALTNFDKDIGFNYIEKHCSEYELLKGTDINEALKGKKFNVIEKEKGLGTWTGTFMFQEDGRIQEGGNKYVLPYSNKRTWKIENDSLICTATPSQNTKTVSGEVRRIVDSNNVYYLAFNGETPYLLMH